VTSSYLTQTIEGLEKLIQMPFGCGEQNMIVFARMLLYSNTWRKAASSSRKYG